jgi:hypothetical protein
MSECERGLEAQIFFHHVQVGMAHACPTDFDKHLSRAWRRLWNIRDLGSVTDASKPYRSHDPFLLCARVHAREFLMTVSARDENRYWTAIERALGDTPQQQMANAARASRTNHE